jgi:hypothetical protein
LKRVEGVEKLKLIEGVYIKQFPSLEGPGVGIIKS